MSQAVPLAAIFYAESVTTAGGVGSDAAEQGLKESRTLTKAQITVVSTGAQKRKVQCWILHETGHSDTAVSCVCEIQVSCSEIHGKFFHLAERHFLGGKCTKVNRSIPWPAVQSRGEALLCLVLLGLESHQCRAGRWCLKQPKQEGFFACFLFFRHVLT